MESELTISQVTKIYGNDKRALNEVSLVLTPGVYGLVGPNGAGKSTLMNILTQNLRQTSGTVSYCGEEIWKSGAAYRAVLGYMPQQQVLAEAFTGVQFLWYMAALKGMKRSDAKKRTTELLTLVNLDDVIQKEMERNNVTKPGEMVLNPVNREYSGGMKQRLLLAQALLNNPRVLILDEPTAGLDPRERIRFRNLIAEQAFDKIVLLATHVISDIEYIAKEIIVLDSGTIRIADSPEAIMESIASLVHEICVPEEMVEQVRKQYRVCSIRKEHTGIWMRILAEYAPECYRERETGVSLDDAYLYYFGQNA